MDQKVEKSVKNGSILSSNQILNMLLKTYEEIAQNHQVANYSSPVDIKDQLIEFLKLV